MSTLQPPSANQTSENKSHYKTETPSNSALISQRQARFFGKSSSSAADDERLLPRLTARGQHRCEIGRAAANHMSRL